MPQMGGNGSVTALTRPETWNVTSWNRNLTNDSLVAEWTWMIVRNASSWDDNVTPSEEDSTVNSTDKSNSYYFYKTETLTFLWILFATIVIGNLSVLTALGLAKSKKSRMTFFIMHLAIADLSVGLVSVLTDIMWKTVVGFHGGVVTCKLVKFLQIIVTFSSTYVLVALSIDRYDAIRHPMNFSGGPKRARILVCVAWLLSVLFSTPTLILYKLENIDGKTQCWIHLEKTEWKFYIMVVAIGLFFIPTLIISACYTIIVYTIWTKSKELTPKVHSMDRNESVGKKQRLSEKDSKRASSRGIIPRAKIKTVKLTFVIVIVFVLCWSPYFFYDIFQVFEYIPITNTTIAVSTFVQSLATLNSAANPLIYCLFSTHICRNLRKSKYIDRILKIFCCCFYDRCMKQSKRRMGSENKTYSSSMTAMTQYAPGAIGAVNQAEQNKPVPKQAFCCDTKYEKVGKF
ncbi:NPSR1 (predicted) [Pycnogonum litorale]